jgi:hypothetical protein
MLAHLNGVEPVDLEELVRVRRCSALNSQPASQPARQTDRQTKKRVGGPAGAARTQQKLKSVLSNCRPAFLTGVVCPLKSHPNHRIALSEGQAWAGLFGIYLIATLNGRPTETWAVGSI